MATWSDPAASHQPLTHAVAQPPAFLHDRATQSASTCRCPVAALLKSCILIFLETGSRFLTLHCFSFLLSQVELGQESTPFSVLSSNFQSSCQSHSSPNTETKITKTDFLGLPWHVYGLTNLSSGYSYELFFSCRIYSRQAVKDFLMIYEDIYLKAWSACTSSRNVHIHI